MPKSLRISLIIISIISLIKSENEEGQYGIVKVPFTMSGANEYLEATFNVGTPAQKMKLIVDLGGERTFLSKDIYQKSASSSYNSLDTPDSQSNELYSVEGIVSTDNFDFGEKEEDKKVLKNFQFVYANSVKGDNDINGIISFGKEYDTKRFSIVYKLSSVSITFYNMFQIKFESSNSGIITIGDLNDEVKKKEHLKHQCLLVEGRRKIKWACELTHSFIGNLEGEKYDDPFSRESGIIIEDERKKRITNINQPVDFETVYNKLFVSKDYIYYLQKYYFYDSDGNSVCNLVERSGVSYFTCSKSDLKKLQKLNFVFSNKMALSFTPENLFNCPSNECNSFIAYDSRFENGFLFGLPIFKNFQVVFDYNVAKLSFFGEDNISYVQMPKGFEFSFTKFLVILLIILIVILLIGIGMIYMLRNKNKVRKQIQDQIYENF